MFIPVNQLALVFTIRTIQPWYAKFADHHVLPVLGLPFVLLA
jgi:hypothetical protein